MAIDRRVFLVAALAASAMPAQATPEARVSRHDRLIEIARGLVADNAARIVHSDVVALADFAKPSWSKRFHLVDIERAEVSSFLVAHGRGSDPRHTGWLQTFSNDIGSNATSSGVYRTGGTYEGKYGRAMRLEGLDTDNSNALTRAIVMHSAWYAEDGMLAKYGKLGRSEGCFTLSRSNLGAVLDRLAAGRLLFAGKL